MNEQLEKLLAETRLSVWTEMPKVKDILIDLRCRVSKLAPDLGAMSREQIVNAVLLFAMETVGWENVQSAVDRWKESHL